MRLIFRQAMTVLSCGFCRIGKRNYAQAAAMVAEAGYRSGLTCAANYTKNPFEIPRKAIYYGDTLPGYLGKNHKKSVPKASADNLTGNVSC